MKCSANVICIIACQFSYIYNVLINVCGVSIDCMYSKAESDETKETSFCRLRCCVMKTIAIKTHPNQTGKSGNSKNLQNVHNT